MKNTRLYKQFALDFPGADLNHHSFICAPASHSMRFWARSSGSIVISKGRVYCRVDNNELCNALESRYKTCHGEWFGEVSNLKKLEKLLNEHGYTIINYAPFFTPSHQFEPYEDENLTVYQPHEIPQFKGMSAYDQCYCYDKENPDLLGVSYAIDGTIVAMAGMNKTGPYTVELGINVLPQAQGKGYGAMLIRAITTRAHQMFPEYVVTYGTQFSHTQSINLAINAGFSHNWTELMIERMKKD